MTNLTIDMLAATPIGAVAPMAAGTGVDFAAILTGVTPLPAPDIAPAIVLSLPADAAGSLPIERQGFAGAANPVRPDPTDLPTADAPNFWIALEVSEPAVIVGPPPVVPAVAMLAIAPPIAEIAAPAGVTILPQPDHASVDRAVRVASAQQGMPAAAEPAMAPILPAPLRCAPIENGKPAHKPAAVLFETTAIIPPSIVSLKPEPRRAVSELTPASDPEQTTAKVSPKVESPVASTLEQDVATAITLPAIPANAPVGMPVITNAKAIVGPISHPPLQKHGLTIRARDVPADPGLPADLNDEQAPVVDRESAMGDLTPPPIQPSPILVSDVPAAITPTVARPPSVAAPIVPTTIPAALAIRSMAVVSPTLQPRVPRNIPVTPQSGTPNAPMPAIEPVRDPAATKADTRPVAAAPSALAPQAIVAAPPPATDAPIVIDLRAGSQPVSPAPVALDMLRVVGKTPAQPIAPPNPPNALAAAVPVIPSVAPAPSIREAVAAATADDPLDVIDTDIPPVASIQTVASIIPRATLAAPGPVTVDTTRIDWIEALIDRIDENRGASGNRSAHIRLLPDALGAVDVRVQHDGDRVNVSVTAENPQARAMLAEAVPRLVELAESRGLRVGDAGIDQGRQGQRSGGQQQPSAPPRAPVVAETDHATDDMSDRIA